MIAPRALGSGPALVAAGACDLPDRATLLAREVGDASGTGRGDAKAPVLLRVSVRQ